MEHTQVTPPVGVSIVDVGTRCCRYILPEKIDGLPAMCGEPVEHLARPYCRAHYKMIYLPFVPRKV